MELTNELKARFFALYWGQKVFTAERHQYLYSIGPDEMQGLQEFTKDGYYLELRPLSSITEEELIGLCDFCKPNKGYDNSAKLNSAYYILKDLGIESIDWLRSKGFLLPFMGIPPEQWVEWGVVKLKTE